MNQNKQPEALRLADALPYGYELARDELRRLHTESELHLQELRSYRITVENREARIVDLEKQLAAAQQGVQAEVPYDDCLNDLGWDMHDFLIENGAAFDGRVFNNIKQFLKESIEKWLAAHPTPQGLEAKRMPMEHADACKIIEDSKEYGPMFILRNTELHHGITQEKQG